MNLRLLKVLALFFSLILSTYAQQTTPQDTTNIDGRAGYKPDLKSGIASIFTFLMIEDDDEPAEFLRYSKLDSLTNPWFDWKKKLNKDLGLQLSLSYTTSNQYGHTSPQNQNEYAGSGILKLYSRWALVNKHKTNNGVLAFGVEHRHKYSEISPNNLGFALGYEGIPALLFSDAKFILGDLNWQQIFNKGRTGVIIGRYDPNDYFDVLGYANPVTSFQNIAILLNPSIAFADWSTGIGVGHSINDQWQIKFSVSDANGSTTDPQFFNDFSELYTTGELSWSPTKDDRYFKNIHITGWKVDERKEAGVEKGQGIAVGANWTFFEQFMPFVRAGWSEGTASIYSQYYGGGLIYKPNLNKDLLGVGISWGKTQTEIGQLTTEVFYRFQVSQNFAITPSFQYLNNPALAPETNNVIIAGLRGRLAF